MDIRRTILWVIFSFSLLLLWNNWQIHNGKQPLFGNAPQSESQGSKTSSVSQTTSGDTSIPDAQPEASPASQETPETTMAVEASNTNSESEIVTVSTDVLTLSFDTIGAQLVKAEINKYFDTNDKTQPMVLLDKTPTHTYVAQTGVVGAAAGKSYPTHLSTFKLISNNNENGRQIISFESENDGVKVIKTYTVNPEDYSIEVTHSITNLGDQDINPSLYVQLTRDSSDIKETSAFYRTFTGPALYSQEEKFQKVSFSDIDKNKAKYIKNTDNGWIGMVQHYFASAWVLPQGIERNNEVLHLNNNLYAVRSIQPVGTIHAGQTKDITANLWVGPQDQKAMSELAPGLELVVDYGWLTIIAKPLFKIMTWLHAAIGNWGWTIVVLTLLIKLVFYPLSAASYRSMAKMKQITPRMKALREQYGDDRAKLNAAMMEMYRTEKINPLGGCLPMIVQIPVFIALYWVLLGSVEMRGAPWILWIQDLSARDPWFILPAFMMATMFLQIKLNPTPPDPMQARVMMIMPLVFGGMMFFFPAGLVLYWCVNNAISIIQQRYIMHKLDKEMAAASR